MIDKDLLLLSFMGHSTKRERERCEGGRNAK